MTLLNRLACGVAVSVLVISSQASAAESASTHKNSPHRVAAKTGADAKLDALLAHVEELQKSLANETAARMALEAKLERATTEAQTTQTVVSDVKARDVGIINTLPSQVAAAVDKVKPKNDGLYFKGVKITPGGFLEAAEVYRQHNLGNDISTGLNSIPFPQTRTGHLEELRFTPRQSRVSALVEGQPNKNVLLSMYGEFDFQGAAQSANSNETNSFNPRIRHLFGAIDWKDSGWHLLAGQSFSLVTLNSNGITPRNEVVPLTIDGQYSVGFTWTRQPGIRLTKDLFDKSLWLAVSAENPQTTFTGSVPAGVINVINNGQGFYAGATNTGAAATQSVNHIPDVVAKVAIEHDVSGHHVHAEVYTLARSFYDQLPTLKTDNLTTVSFGGGLIAQVIPRLLDVQLSGLAGHGIGRYGSGQLPDATFSASGEIKPISETIGLAGITLHATRDLDLWAFGGEEHDDRAAYGSNGYGNALYNNTGCETQGSTLPCTGNTRLLTELSTGFWRRFYTGPWGQVRFGLQYSYINRNAFTGIGGAPTAHENMLYTSFRYYPF